MATIPKLTANVINDLPNPAYSFIQRRVQTTIISTLSNAVTPAKKLTAFSDSLDAFHLNNLPS